MKEPQRRVGGVVESLRFAFGKQIRDQAIANVMGEGAKNVARFSMPPGHQRESFEADHGVAAPVGEPVVAGDDRADLVASGARAGLLGAVAWRGGDKLTGG